MQKEKDYFKHIGYQSTTIHWRGNQITNFMDFLTSQIHSLPGPQSAEGIRCQVLPVLVLPDPFGAR